MQIRMLGIDKLPNIIQNDDRRSCVIGLRLKRHEKMRDDSTDSRTFPEYQNASFNNSAKAADQIIEWYRVVDPGILCQQKVLGFHEKS